MARSAKPKTERDILNELHSSSVGAFVFRTQIFGGAGAVGTSSGGLEVNIVDADGGNFEPSSELLSSSASRTASLQTAAQTNRGHRGVYVFVKSNAGQSSHTLTINIRGRLPGGGSSDFINLLAGSSYHPSSGGGTVRTALLYPDGNATAAGGIDDRASAPLPRIWDVKIVHGTTQAYDYSVRAVRIF